jgi:predicted nuclease with TOPRIM domain
MMTNVSMFEDAKLEAKVKVLKAKVKDLTKRLEKAEAMRRPLGTMDEIAYMQLEKENGDLRTSIGHRIERVEELNSINREHQMMNGKMHSEIEILKKNESLLREDLQSKDLEMGRMMEKLSKKDS